MSDVLGYYKVLGVSQNASDAEIKKKYRDLAKIWHPDHNKTPLAMEKFQHISVAYDVLSDDESRKNYDVFCVAYKMPPAPDMNVLKVYKNIKGQEATDLRVLNIYKSGKVKKIICSESEAIGVVLKSLFDIKNYTSKLFSKEANLQMLLHNALACYFEGKQKLAVIYALQATEFANKEEKELIVSWANDIGVMVPKQKTWHYKRLESYRFLPFFIVLAMGLILALNKYAGNYNLFSYNKEVEYFKKVELWDGRQIVDDVDIGKIINYPVDLNDDKMLYHLGFDVVIKFGPSEKFDSLAQGVRGQTVRVTGITPDEVWLRVMIDDGQMGYVKAGVVRKGIGNPISDESKIVE